MAIGANRRPKQAGPLSRSALKAYDALVIGSDTAPVRELIQHGETGLLVPFDDAEALAATLLAALQQPARLSPLRQRARQHIQAHQAAQSLKCRCNPLVAGVDAYAFRRQLRPA